MAKITKGDLFEKLQGLKEWQRKQQEKLFSQQKEQQEEMKRKQRQTMENLGLKRTGYPFDREDDDGCIKTTTKESKTIEDTNEKEGDITVEDKENNPGNITLDDTPIQSTKKNFKELLEEYLKKESSSANHQIANAVELKSKPKRPFLKKGEGLKRFRLKPKQESNKRLPLKTTNKNKVASSNVLNTRGTSAKEKTTYAHTNGPRESSKDESKEEVGSKSIKLGFPTASFSLEREGDHYKTLKKYNSQDSDNTTWASVLTHERNKQNRDNIPEIQAENISVVNGRQLEKNSKPDVGDLTVFELLEQMAGDSSFCSTSSTLLGFMESPVISTPLKAILEKNKKSEAKADNSQLQLSKSTKQLPFGMDECDDSASSKDDFDSSSDSCYSASEQTDVRGLLQGMNRVRFSNHVEKREFDPGIDDSSMQECLPPCNDKEFKDTEVWSDHASDSSSDSQDENLTMTSAVDDKHRGERERLKKDISAPLIDKNVTNSYPLSSNINSENGDQEFLGPSDIIFKSEMLHTRLLELEHEIEIFRKNNEELARRKQLQEQAEARWLKEKREIENKFKEKEEFLKNTIMEERKKLNKEKQVFETYCKELRNQPTKQEREEIQTLRQKLDDLLQEMRKKESRHSAAQNRISSRLKALEKENSELKEQVEKLKKEKQLEAKRRLNRFANTRNVSNTKTLHSINEQLAQIYSESPDASIIIQDVIPKKPIPKSLLMEEAKAGTKSSSKLVTKTRAGTSKRNSSSDINAKSFPGASKGISLRRIQSVPNLIEKISTDEKTTSEVIEDPIRNTRITGSGSEIVDKAIAEEIPVSDSNLKDTLKFHDVESTDSQLAPDSLTAPNVSMPFSVNYSYNLKYNSPKNSTPYDMSRTLEGVAAEAIYSRGAFSLQNAYQTKVDSVPTAAKLYPMKKVNPDGSCEIRYENGNFKRISADGKISKLFYFNGDVKENLADGTSKYYYSETRTWHTTFPDGLEVLEFPNGQVERRLNGKTEVSFPDGTVRLLHPNGKEEVILTDGTVATTEPNGDRVIQLPNGQQEFQTADYKKRIYPDGTVKIVYSDGVQETRYASGRVRLRDSTGNLVMDSET